jgi:hypothetical protein
MGEERAIVFSGWPQPDAGAPLPSISADENSLFVRYSTDAGKVAVVYFRLYDCFTFGSPGDETLIGHRLFGRGLGFYSTHRVENSAWIAQLERQNSVHPQHDKERFLLNKTHYIITFHDTTFECVVNEGGSWPTEVSVFNDHDEAIAYIQSKYRR